MRRIRASWGEEARNLLLNFSRSSFVYIVASRSHNLYTGVTNNLERRIIEHRAGLVPGFTKRYRIYRFVYYEVFGHIRAAIAREKQIKAWGREKKIALIQEQSNLDRPGRYALQDREKADPSVQTAGLGMTTFSLLRGPGVFLISGISATLAPTKASGPPTHNVGAP